ncbi:MAG: M28 family peptidase [Chlorobi bacterium]|nr:M28 family peptidase [Chlorobiota bacterium]
MKTITWLITGLLLLNLNVKGQANSEITNPVAEAILHGNYNPADYMPSIILNQPDSIINGLINDISTDSLLSYLEHLDTFYNRNTGSDTISNTNGIGAARRWIYSKFEEFSKVNENRLIVTFNEFDANICGKGHHKNVLAILPGIDTTQKEILLIEGHFDTRCEGVCDTVCYTPGMDDNGSGTVLVMELARVMSKYAFNRTIIFATVTGEDQGLYGSSALADYCKQEEIPLLAVFNNDVVGGVICGQTASPPGCPGYLDVDSMNVRIFSYAYWGDSTANSQPKQLARYIKMHQEERINPLLATPLNINIMINEDRGGRGGDHIPFRQNGYTAIRFCSQNEFGDGTGTPPDHQHTTNDILGLDTDTPPDGIIDSFFVDVNYLRRNALSNGINVGFLANSPATPSVSYTALDYGINFEITGTDTIFNIHRVGVRSKGSGTLYFDSIYTFENTNSITINNLAPAKKYMFTLMNVENGIESNFPDEVTVVTTGLNELPTGNRLVLGQNFPNPASIETTIKILNKNPQYVNKNASILLIDICGRIIQTIPFSLTNYSTEVKLDLKDLMGVYYYSIYIDNRKLQTKKLVVL